MNEILNYISNTKNQVYNNLIQASQNLDKKQLLELFSKTLNIMMQQDNQILQSIANTNNLSLATECAKATEQSIKSIDNVADEIISRNNQIEAPSNENKLPGNMLI